MCINNNRMSTVIFKALRLITSRKDPSAVVNCGGCTMNASADPSPLIIDRVAIITTAQGECKPIINCGGCTIYNCG